MPWLCPPLAFMPGMALPCSCRPSGRGAALSFDFCIDLLAPLIFILMQWCVKRGMCVTYIFVGDAVANVVVGLGEGAVVA